MLTSTRSVALALFAALALALAAGPATAQPQPGSVIHDPWLNWDFLNFTNQQVNDFEIVVSSPTYNPDPKQGQVLITCLCITIGFL